MKVESRIAALRAQDQRRTRAQAGEARKVITCPDGHKLGTLIGDEDGVRVWFGIPDDLYPSMSKTRFICYRSSCRGFELNVRRDRIEDAFRMAVRSGRDRIVLGDDL